MKAEGESTDAGVKSKHWRMVIALMLIYMYAFIDRTFIALLVEPIKADVGASDVEMGLILGFSFAFFYCISNVPAGYFADRLNRRKMLAIGSLLWGGMTILCGMSHSFGQLFAARAGAGAAEGIIAPTVYSMMRDAVPPKSRALAFSIYGLAPMLGTALALVGGGYLLGAFGSGGLLSTGMLDWLAPWQRTLIVVGLCGLPLSLLLLTFPEPKRSAGKPVDTGIIAGLLDACRFMISNWRLYGPLLLFSGSAAMINFSQNAWLPTALGRAFHLLPQEVGPALGAMTISGGVIGLLVAAWLMNAASHKGRGVLGYGIAGAIGTASGLTLALASTTVAMAYFFNFCGLLFVGLSFAVGATTLTAMTPADKIGRVSAVYLIFETLAGQTVGPLLVAFLSDHILGGPATLPLALSIMVVIYAIIATSAALVLRRALAVSPMAR